HSALDTRPLLRAGGLFLQEPQNRLLRHHPVSGVGTTQSCAPGIVLNISTACSGVTMSRSPMMSSVGASILSSSSFVKLGSAAHIAFRRPRTTGQCFAPSGERRT